MGRISPGPIRWPPGAERRLVPAKSNLKPQTSSSGISQCPSVVLSAALVAIIWTPPLVARPLRSPSVHPRVPHGSLRGLLLLGCAVLVLVSCQLCAVSCGFCGWCVGAVMRCPGVRVSWLVLWCRGVWSGAAGWARRIIPVFAGMSRRARGSRVASSWPLACSW